MKKFDWLLFLEKFTLSMFILTIFIFLVNKSGFGMSLLNLKIFLNITIILILFYFFLRLKSFYFNLNKFWEFIQKKFSLFVKINQKYQTSKIFRRVFDWLIVPFFLIVLGSVLFLNNVLHQEEPFSVLVQSQNKSIPIYGKSGEILSGEKIAFEFKAIEDNLGIVAVRFATFNRINDDILAFRIKEKWDKDWYYENDYKTDQFQPNQLFPFGFPVIQSSKNKVYQLEIESTKGVIGNAVSLTGLLPVFQAKYQFSKDKILSSRQEKLIFVKKKLLNLMSNREFSATSIIFFYPFFFYLLWYFISKRYFKKAHILVYFIFLGILLDGTLISKINDQINLLFICLWILIIFLYKINYRYSVFASLSTLFICFFLFMFGNFMAANKISNWIYFFLIIAIIQLLFGNLSQKLKDENIK